MKPTLVLISVCFVLGSCAKAPQEAHTEEKKSGAEENKSRAEEKTPREALYPYSAIVKVYDTVFDAMTDGYFSKHPALDKEHTAKLKAFIQSEYSSKEFLQEIVKDKYAAIFDRAATDKAYRRTKEFTDSFIVMVNVSVPIAKMIIGGLMDIYVAKYIEKDPIKMELFEMATGEDRQYVSWVQGEVTIGEFRKEAGDKREVQEGDRFFGFRSPPSTWEDMCGRQGFLHVRGKKIIEVIVTKMN